MNEHKIILNESDNPKYYSLMSRHQLLWDEWGRINKLLVSYKQPRFFLFGKRKQLASLFADPMKKLQSDFDQWSKDVYEMTVHPKDIFIPPSPDSQATFCHYIGILRDFRNSAEVELMTLVWNYDRVYSTIDMRISFNIAIVSATFSFLGCLLAVILGCN